MTTAKLVSTLPEDNTDLRVIDRNGPILRAENIAPSRSGWKVLGAFNPTCFTANGEIFLIVRVDERPESVELETQATNSKAILVPYLDLAVNGSIRTTPIAVPQNFDPDRESTLPEAARKTGEAQTNAPLQLSFMSHLRLARLTNGRLVASDSPLLFPDCIHSRFGCEDPRAATIDGRTFVSYGAIGQCGATAWLAELDENFLVKSKRMLLGPDHKHSALFPSLIQNQYAMAYRPLTRISIGNEGVWSLFSKDLQHWGNPHPLLFPRPDRWDSVRVGPGPSPVLTSSGWLLLYYGVDSTESYHLGAALLDRVQPQRVLARSNLPILSPRLPWERNGRRADTLFTCGARLQETSGELDLFYGAADSAVGRATVRLSSVLAELSS